MNAAFFGIAFMGFSLLLRQSRLWTRLLRWIFLPKSLPDITLTFSAVTDRTPMLQGSGAAWPSDSKYETSFWPWSSIHEPENSTHFLDLPGLGFFTCRSVWAMWRAPAAYRKSCASCYQSEWVDFILIYGRRRELQGKQKIGRVSFPGKTHF